MTESKKTELLNAINEYFEGEDWDAITMKELDEYLEKGSMGLAYTTERDYHEIQAEYSFINEQYEYYVDCELIETRPCPLDEFIDDIDGADFCGFLEPCTRYVNKMYEPLDERATQILGKDAEVFPNQENDKTYLVVVWGRPMKKYYVDDIEELKGHVSEN